MAKMKAFPLWPHSTWASFSFFLWHLWDQSLWIYSLLYPYLTLCLPQDNDIHLLTSWMNKGVNESQTRKAAWDITREGTESFITHIHFSLSSRSKYIVLSTPCKHTLNCRALEQPGMPFLFHPESSSLSFTFQINYPFSRERCLSVQSQPLSMLLFQLWASFLYHSYKNGALCLCLWLFIYQWFPSVDSKLQRTKSCLFFIHYL